MNQLYLADRESIDNLFPFTLTRSAADIRIGIFTIREKWQRLLGSAVTTVSKIEQAPHGANLLSSSIIPTRTFVRSLFSNGKLSSEPLWSSVRVLQFPWHIFQWNDWAIREDFAIMTEGRKSHPLPASVSTICPEQIFVEAGARLSHCIINAEAGPVYIGRGAEIMEGCTLRGPSAICEGAVVKMGTRIYGATTIGPYCTAGGEIKNSVMFGYSNKGHDGYLGDSVIGEWCNLGAGTSNSNVKNNAGFIRMYNHAQGEYVDTGLLKCGLIMGDYSRAAVNTSFNTGTVAGVSANIFGSGLTPKYIPSFSWGIDGITRYTFEKAIDDIGKWKKLKGHSLNEDEKNLLKLIFDQI